jgi:two-component system NtrC family response regulator
MFRADLYYRLDVIHVTLPALRERTDDLPHLVLAMARRHARLYEPVLSLDPLLVDHLGKLAFPGNIHELEHAVERMLFQKTSGDTLTLADWNAQQQSEVEPSTNDALAGAAATLWQRINGCGDSYPHVLEELERRLLAAALAAGGRTRRELAALLRISERKLYQKLRAYRLSETGALTANSSSTPAGSRKLRQSLSHAV